MGLLTLLAACNCRNGEPTTATVQTIQAAELSERSGASPESEGEFVRPPFGVSGNLSGLYIVWFDEAGTHVAETRDDVPVEHRDYVRLDSLSLDPSERLDPEYIYLGDIREPGEDGKYPVRKFRRTSFEALIDHSVAGPEANDAEDGVELAPHNADVIIYGASWCGACRSAARFFREEGVAFVEKDIERDAGARAEMERKARAAGIPVGSIPVIDFRGTILQGFDRVRLRRLIRGNTRSL